MTQPPLRACQAVLTLFLAITSVTCLAQSPAPRVKLDLPAQSLSASLTQFGRDAGVEIEFTPESVQGKTAPALKGELDTDQALKRLLQGTGLSYRTTSQGAIVVEAAKAAEGKQLSIPSGPAGAPSGTAAGKNPNDPPNLSMGASLEEIVVTAQKRQERLQDVPVPVTAIGSDDLVQQNQLRLQDYYARIPGLSLTPSGRADEQVLSIRGISTGGGNPTVGIVVDDVPYGSSSGYAGGGSAPDLDPSELARVEVLRGPQGTLYGASSIGGLFKFVTLDPSPTERSGRIVTGVNSVENGNSPGYSVRGMINAPLGEGFAVRASAFTRVDAGFIDNTLLNSNGINEETTSGGRVSMLWKPADNVSLKLGALLQENKFDGAAEVEPALGDLRQQNIEGTGYSKKRVGVFNATVDVSEGGIDITSVTGFSFNHVHHIFDFTQEFGALSEAVFGETGTPLDERINTDKFSQEVRVAGKAGMAVDWLVGAFYTKEHSKTAHQLLAVEPDTGEVAGTWLNVFFPTTFEEYAGFADATAHLSSRFDLQLGARESKNRQTYAETDQGPFVSLLLSVPSPLVNPQIDTSDTSFTYLVTPSFKVTPETLLYARLATGYRAGGPNPTSTVFNLPPQFQPDKTLNYEVGLKGTALNRLLTYDASIYYIDWKNIQLSLVDPATSAKYFANASRAKSQGAELSVEARPIPGFSIVGSMSWNNAELTENFPADSDVYGKRGDRLPFSSRFSGSLSVGRVMPLTAVLDGSLGASLSYVGDRRGAFVGSPARQDYPGYAQLDLRSGITYRGTLNANLYANNVTNRRGLLGGGVGTDQPLSFAIIQPRTVGVTITRDF
jgi:iron complex outermembrane recepter protein